MEGTPPLILASASPRRRELLHRLGLEPRIEPADIVEIPGADEAPAAYVERLAREKALAVAQLNPDALVVAGDTTVVLDGQFLEKPADAEGATEMLRRLSGRTHEVLTALAVVPPGASARVYSRVDRTAVTFRTISDDEIAGYVATGEPMDKAGAYGIQGMAGAFVSGIEGDYFTVVGLSLAGLVELMRDAGWAWRPGRLAPILSD